MILESLKQNETDSVESVEPMSDTPQWREWAKEEITKRRFPVVGSTVGERMDHRGWPPDVTLTFLHAEVIKPTPGRIQSELYPRQTKT